MDKIEYELTPEPVFPDLVFKYRTWSKAWHQSILTEREVYYSSPEDFDDEIDCQLDFHYESLQLHDLLNLGLKHFFRTSPHGSIDEAISWSYQMLRKNPYLNDEARKEFNKQALKDYMLRVGVLSTAKTNDNQYCWENYADFGKGFCVGLDCKRIANSFGGGGGEVQYDDNLPIISLNDELMVRWFKRVFYKREKYRPEDEYRLTKTYDHDVSDDERKVVLAPEIFHSIYFGWDMSEKAMKEIREIASQISESITFYQVINHHTGLKLKQL